MTAPNTKRRPTGEPGADVAGDASTRVPRTSDSAAPRRWAKRRPPVEPILADGQPCRYALGDGTLCSGQVWSRALVPKGVPLPGVHLWLRARDGFVLVARGPGGEGPWRWVAVPPTWDVASLGIPLTTEHYPAMVPEPVALW